MMFIEGPHSQPSYFEYISITFLDDKGKEAENTAPVCNANFMLYFEKKRKRGSLPWHWKPCFPNPLKNRNKQSILTYFVLDAVF